jgi:hypothetical protein
MTPADPPWGIVDPVTLDHAYEPPLRGFIAAEAGDVAVVMADGSTGVYPSCAAGAVYGGMIVQILSEGTTATGIKGFA